MEVKNWISPVQLPVQVLGLTQKAYEVNGVVSDLTDAVRIAELDNVNMIEGLLAATGAVTRRRIQKLDELGEMLAFLAYAETQMSDKKLSDVFVHPSVAMISERSREYRLNIPTQGGQGMSRSDITKAMTRVQHEMERENNQLSQSTTPMNNFINKRDEGYTRISSAVKSVADSAASVIGSLS